MFKSATILFRNVYQSKLVSQVRCASQALPQLSSEKYNVKRRNYGAVQTSDVDYFISILDAERVLTEEDDVLPFNIDWLRNCRGQSKVVLKPKSTQEVSQILSYCNTRKLAVCPQGGNTGVVGGCVPVFDEIVLNMSLMNKILGVDEVSGAVTCEAGCILGNLENHVNGYGLIMPLDLGAKGSCHIGGNISTNAGGQRLMRYGNLHGSLLGIEAVKADGTIIDCLRTLRKDNTGYHLKHLFVGSEGTLGVVTKVAIHCPVLPKSVNVGFFGVGSFEDVLRLFNSAKSSLGEILSAFEMMDSDAITYTAEKLKLSNPIPDYPFYVLAETQGSDAIHDNEKLTRLLTKEMDQGLILNGTVVSEPAKINALWKLREGIATAGLMGNYMFTYDVSLPLANYYDLVPAVRKRIGSLANNICGFGHIGDGNLHINVCVPEFSQEVLSLLEPFVFEEVAKLKGSVSAEHGIGFRKPHFLHYSKNENAMQLMHELKGLLDPNGILNPYKVLPDAHTP